MGGLYVWFRRIFLFCIVSSLIVNLSPGGKSSEHIRFLTKLVIVLMIIEPLISLAGGKSGLADKMYDLYSDYYSETEVSYNTDNSDDYDLTNIVSKQVEDAVSSNVTDMAANYGIKIKKVNVYIEMDENSDNYGKINKITINTSGSSKENVNEYIKAICDYYSIEEKKVQAK
ncbi:MAG: stage III sporulation protein AF [Eubacteriales bacterium]|nr:stage III sporulation protein AF [Eubacteriales bacterium]